MKDGIATVGAIAFFLAAIVTMVFGLVTGFQARIAIALVAEWCGLAAMGVLAGWFK